MELVVLSGKGGTGKTTIAAALSELAKDVVKIDCDVDAPNLYLLYGGLDISRENFYSGKKALIDEKQCARCGKCSAYCKFEAIENFKVDPLLCEGCGTCAVVCPQKAIRLVDEKNADTILTKTDKGILARSEMEIGSDGSGKLVAELRKKGKAYSDYEGIVITDGSPGIGCSVIASITGCDGVLIVTEPTQSGLEDFMRVAALCQYFGITTFVCVNKYDLNNKKSKKIETFCKEEGFTLVGRIPYDDTIIQSINDLKPIIYYEDSKANKAIRAMWENLRDKLK